MKIIFSKKEFAKILNRERVRADRNDFVFSIIHFEVTKSTNFKSLIEYLIFTLSKRVRCCDEIGWIDKRHIGVLLPDTLNEGAHKLANDVCNAIIPRKLHPKYTIYIYPSQWIDAHKKKSMHPVRLKTVGNPIIQRQREEIISMH